MSTYWEVLDDEFDFEKLVQALESEEETPLKIEWYDDFGKKVDKENGKPVLTNGEDCLHIYKSENCVGLKRYGKNDPEPILSELRNIFGALNIVHEQELLLFRGRNE